MSNHHIKRAGETEPAALRRRLVERSGMSSHEAQDAVDAYMHSDGARIDNSRLPDDFRPIAEGGN